jgi:hypothetical protein
MLVHNIYADEKGESHIRDVEIDWKTINQWGKVSDTVNVKTLAFRETDGNYDVDWHNAPRRQYLINLEGSVEIITSDGKSRIFGPGSIILAEDLTGKGHLSKAVAGGARKSLVIPIAD